MVRFGDTDAAGVMHFHNLLKWSHEAWEESLSLYGISSLEIFPNSNNEKTLEILLPIIHCEADYIKPLRTADCLDIELLPFRLDSSSFRVKTKFLLDGKLVAQGLIQHVAINSESKLRCQLPRCIDLWIESSSVNKSPMPL